MWRLSFRGAKDSDGDGLGDGADGLGRRVTLTTDPTQDTFDRYGRLLAYVKTVAGKNLQVEMLRRGWAKVYVYGGKPFQRVDRFRRASGRAAGGRRGVFRRCGGNFHKLIWRGGPSRPASTGRRPLAGDMIYEAGCEKGASARISLKWYSGVPLFGP